jgi:hypothetical protein
MKHVDPGGTGEAAAMRAIRAAIAIRHHADRYGARVPVRPFCELASDYWDAAAFMFLPSSGLTG